MLGRMPCPMAGWEAALPQRQPGPPHHRFLSTFRAAFFVRVRDYSKSVAVAPFIVNYSGALFREYPGPWQVSAPGAGSAARGGPARERACKSTPRAQPPAL